MLPHFGLQTGEKVEQSPRLVRRVTVPASREQIFGGATAAAKYDVRQSK